MMLRLARGPRNPQILRRASSLYALQRQPERCHSLLAQCGANLSKNSVLLDGRGRNPFVVVPSVAAEVRANANL